MSRPKDPQDHQDPQDPTPAVEEGQQVTRHGLPRKTLRAWRQEQDLTMMQLATKAGLSLSAVDHTENGRSVPNVEIAQALARVLDLDVEQIIWLKPQGLSRPPSRLYRQFPPEVQTEMALAVGRVLNGGVAMKGALTILEEQLRARGLGPIEIARAQARVQQLVEEEGQRQQELAEQPARRAPRIPTRGAPDAR